MKKRECNCIAEVNKLLSEKGEQLATAIDWMKGEVFQKIAVEKVSGRGGKTTMLLANFCPFCGIDLRKKLRQPSRAAQHERGR